jgi:3-deoxy-D-manno-octulosonic acid kinase
MTIRERLHTAGGVTAIYDGSRYAEFDARWFDHSHYRDQGAVLHSTTGRGGVLLLDVGAETWVLRHYHRGGLVARFVYDHYLWTGPERARPIREWRLLAHLHERGLPVPRPIAARAVRYGPIYRADIVTSFIPGVRPLSAFLREGEVADETWIRIGEMLRRFHGHGVDHPDLTAHNILLGAGNAVFLVDFDNARMRPPGAWEQAGIERLQRSLRKVALETGTSFDERAWRLARSSYSDTR